MIRTDLFLTKEDLFRFGNSQEPRLTHIREGDIQTVVVAGVLKVLPQTGGISVNNREGLAKRPLFGHVWIIRVGTAFPPCLELVPDPNDPTHFFICPRYLMPLDDYKSALALLAKSTIYSHKKAATKGK
jgi:hypothetical protein